MSSFEEPKGDKEKVASGNLDEKEPDLIALILAQIPGKLAQALVEAMVDGKPIYQESLKVLIQFLSQKDLKENPQTISELLDYRNNLIFTLKKMTPSLVQENGSLDYSELEEMEQNLVLSFKKCDLKNVSLDLQKVETLESVQDELFNILEGFTSEGYFTTEELQEFRKNYGNGLKKEDRLDIKIENDKKLFYYNLFYKRANRYNSTNFDTISADIAKYKENKISKIKKIFDCLYLIKSYKGIQKLLKYINPLETYNNFIGILATNKFDLDLAKTVRIQEGDLEFETEPAIIPSRGYLTEVLRRIALDNIERNYGENEEAPGMQMQMVIADISGLKGANAASPKEEPFSNGDFVLVTSARIMQEEFDKLVARQGIDKNLIDFTRLMGDEFAILSRLDPKVFNTFIETWEANVKIRLDTFPHKTRNNGEIEYLESTEFKVSHREFPDFNTLETVIWTYFSLNNGVNKRKDEIYKFVSKELSSDEFVFDYEVFLQSDDKNDQQLGKINKLINEYKVKNQKLKENYDSSSFTVAELDEKIENLKKELPFFDEAFKMAKRADEEYVKILKEVKEKKPNYEGLQTAIDKHILDNGENRYHYRRALYSMLQRKLYDPVLDCYCLEKQSVELLFQTGLYGRVLGIETKPKWANGVDYDLGDDIIKAAFDLCPKINKESDNEELKKYIQVVKAGPMIFFCFRKNIPKDKMDEVGRIIQTITEIEFVTIPYEGQNYEIPVGIGDYKVEVNKGVLNEVDKLSGFNWYDNFLKSIFKFLGDDEGNKERLRGVILSSETDPKNLLELMYHDFFNCSRSSLYKAGMINTLVRHQALLSLEFFSYFLGVMNELETKKEGEAAGDGASNKVVSMDDYINRLNAFAKSPSSGVRCLNRQIAA